jgi:hypothetical protein
MLLLVVIEADLRRNQKSLLGKSSKRLVALVCASPGELHLLSRTTRVTSFDESTSSALPVETSTSVLQSPLTGNREKEVLSQSISSPRKKKLLQLRIMLDIPFGETADRFPVNGISRETVHNQASRKFRCAQLLHSTIVEAIDNLLFTEDTYLSHTAANQMLEVNRVNQLRGLRDNTEHLAY